MTSETYTRPPVPGTAELALYGRWYSNSDVADSGRRFRMKRITIAELAELIEIGASTIGKIERAHKGGGYVSPRRAAVLYRWLLENGWREPGVSRETPDEPEPPAGPPEGEPAEIGGPIDPMPLLSQPQLPEWATRNFGDPEPPAPPTTIVLSLTIPPEMGSVEASRVIETLLRARRDAFR